MTAGKLATLYQRNLVSLIIVSLLTMFLSSCASTDAKEAEEERARAFQYQLKEDLVLGVREALREEILPELSLLSPFSEEVRKEQSAAQQRSSQKIIVGRIEWVGFTNPSFEVQARIDSGAQTCSLHAENIQEQNIDGDTYVQFETFDQEGNKHVLLRKVVATRRVRSTTGDLEKRYVIREKISLGGHVHEVNINLNDRSKLRYRLLVGRNLLMGRYLVDVSQSRLLGR